MPQWVSDFLDWFRSLKLYQQIVISTGILAGLGALWAIIFGQRGIFQIFAGLIQGFLKFLKKAAQWRTTHVDQPIINRLPSRVRWIDRVELSDAKDKLSANNLLAIEGPRGSGKTTLALELSYYFLKDDLQKPSRERQFDAYIWISVKHRDFTLPAFLDEIALKFDYLTVSQAEADAKSSLLLNFLSGRRFILIADNFESISLASEAISSFILSLPQSSKVIITTSRPIQWLTGYATLRLEGMTRPESVQLIRQESSRQGLHILAAFPEEKLANLHEVTGGMPLAIEWALGQMRQGQAFEVLINRLRNARGNIFQELFSESWNLLDNKSRQLLMGFTVFKESATGALLRNAVGLSPHECDEALAKLAGLCLIAFTPELDERIRRYSLHPLTYTFAQAKAKQVKKFIQEVSKRTAAYYINFAKRRHEVKVSGAVAREVEIELQNILGLLDWCFETRQRRLGVQLTAAIEDLLFILGLFEERIHYSKKAAEACEALGDKSRKAHFLTVIGGTMILQARHEEAEAHLLMALQAAESAGGESEVARAKRALASSLYRQRQYEKATEILKGVEELALEADDVPACIDALFLRANLHFMQGDLTQAERDCKIMLEYSDNIGWERAKAYTYGQLGDIYALQENEKQAENCFRHGLQIAVEYGDRRQIARLQLSQAKVALCTGQARKARTLLKEAIDTFTRLGMKNELGEAQAAMEKLETWPLLLWPLVSRIVIIPTQYTKLPLGGD